MAYELNNPPWRKKKFIARLFTKFNHLTSMQIKFFTIPITAVSDYNEELNAFLRSHKVVETEKQLVQTSNGDYWCICISYLVSGVAENSSREKTDYIKTLEPDVFARFSRLREIRKKIAADDGVSAYVVFTDAELAEIAKLPELTMTSLKKIKGIGDKKTEKYGAPFLQMFKTGNDETSRVTDAPDNLF